MLKLRRIWYGLHINNFLSSWSLLPVISLRWYHSSFQLMAGHNRWSKIKRPKAAADLERSKQVGKLCAEIRTAVRLGGDDPNTNLRLAGVISRARAIEISKATIENVIASSSDITISSKQSSTASLLYEAKSNNGGYSVLIEATANNRNRTKTELQKILKQHKAVMVEPKTIQFQFDHKGIVTIAKNSLAVLEEDSTNNEEIDCLEIAIEIGAEDVNENDDYDNIEFICDPKDLQTVTSTATSKGMEVTQSAMTYIPNTWASLSQGASERANGLISHLNEHPDVIKVHTNIKPN